MAWVPNPTCAVPCRAVGILLGSLFEAIRRCCCCQTEHTFSKWYLTVVTENGTWKRPAQNCPWPVHGQVTGSKQSSRETLSSSRPVLPDLLFYCNFIHVYRIGTFEPYARCRFPASIEPATRLQPFRFLLAPLSTDPLQHLHHSSSSCCVGLEPGPPRRLYSPPFPRLLYSVSIFLPICYSGCDAPWLPRFVATWAKMVTDRTGEMHLSMQFPIISLCAPFFDSRSMRTELSNHSVKFWQTMIIKSTFVKLVFFVRPYMNRAVLRTQ